MRNILGRSWGTAALLGGILALLFFGAEAVNVDTDFFFAAAPLLPLLLFWAAVGLASATDGWGWSRIGLGILLVGSLSMFAGIGLMAWADNDVGWAIMAAGMLLLPLGFICWGIGNLREPLLPRWRGLPLLMGLVMLAGFFFDLSEEWRGIPWEQQTDTGFYLFLAALSFGWILLGLLHLMGRGNGRAPAMTAAATVVAFLLLLLPGVDVIGLINPPEPALTVDPEQTILFHNGVILTMDPAQSQAEAIAIRGQKILAVGSDETILALRRPDSRVVDLDGRTIMPGFVDAHTHLFNDAEQSFDMDLAEIQQVALANGITTLGNLYVNSDFLREIQNFERRGQLQIRTSLYLIGTDNCGNVQDDWWREHPPTRAPGEMLRINGVKLFTDGGTCGAPALSYEVRPGEGLGDLFFEQWELNRLVKNVQGAGYQVAIHAIGDRAIEQALNAVATALAGGPNAPRHRIEHNSIIRPDLLPRYGEIGVIPVIFGQYPTCEPFGPPPPAAYQAWEWPWPALLAANPGLSIAWHGDDPFFGRVRPLDDLYSLLTRNEVGPDGAICRAPAWQEAHVLTAAQALPMMTTNAAYALFRDEEVGQLNAGRYADLILLSANPLTVDLAAIPQMNVLMTMVGGQVAYCADAAAALCPTGR